MPTAPSMTVEPDRFDEAMDEFLSRRLMSRDEANELQEYARRRAFWISGVAQLDIARQAHESIADAMERGIPFEEWQKSIEGRLTEAWGRKDSWRVQVIFRNATIQAANAGRWRQMHKPHVLKARPYLEFDGIRDSHECPICAACNGVVLPADHPWWATHSPILHHACRCGVLSLRRSQAEAKGVTVDVPGVAADDGFGLPPDQTAPPKPWNTANPPDPALEHAFGVKVADHEQNATHPTIALDPKHDPDYWEQHYRARYGDAAKQVGYGRALLERSKLLSRKQVLDEIDRLRSLGVPGTEGLTLKVNHDVAALMAEHTRTLGPRAVPRMGALRSSPELTAALDRNRRWWSAMSAPERDLPDDVIWDFDASGTRAGYDPVANLVTITPKGSHGTPVHEYAHAVEFSGKLAPLSKAFLEPRTRGEALEKLSDVLGNKAYGPEEVTRKDRLWHPYAGKDYSKLPVSWANDGTELVSLGCGDIADGLVVEMFDLDHESVLFLLGWLRGV